MHIRHSNAPRFSLPGLEVTGLASPSRGARETSAWRLVLAPDTPGTPHAVDREEIFLVLSGRARADLGAESVELSAGDALIVPADQTFALANPYAEPFEAVAVLPIGGQARLANGASFVPPWAQ